MKIKVYQAFEFQMLYSRIKDETLPLKVSYRLSKIYNELVEATDHAREELADTLSKFGEKDDAGNLVLTDDKQSIKIKEGAANACAEALNKLQNKTIDLSDDIKFTFDDLETLSVTASEMQALIPFIVD